MKWLPIKWSRNPEYFLSAVCVSLRESDYLFDGPGAVDALGVLLGLLDVDHAEVLDGQHAVAVDVELGERFIDHLLAHFGHRRIQHVHELFVVDLAVLFWGHTHTIIFLNSQKIA